MSDPENAVSMISLVMLLLTEVREQAADMADSTLTVLILATFFGDIFGDLFGGGRRGGRANQGPMKGMNIRKSVGITFEEAVFGCEKELDVVLKRPMSEM